MIFLTPHPHLHRSSTLCTLYAVCTQQANFLCHSVFSTLFEILSFLKKVNPLPHNSCCKQKKELWRPECSVIVYLLLCQISEHQLGSKMCEQLLYIACTLAWKHFVTIQKSASKALHHQYPSSQHHTVANTVVQGGMSLGTVFLEFSIDHSLGRVQPGRVTMQGGVKTENIGVTLLWEAITTCGWRSWISHSGDGHNDQSQRRGWKENTISKFQVNRYSKEKIILNNPGSW